MALLFLLFFFLHIPCFSHSACPTIHRLCDSDIDIHYPFYTNNSLHAGCNGTYLIHCNDSSNSTPTVQFQDYLERTVEYPVKNISYSDKTITIQYQQYSTLHPNDSPCSFLYEFAPPIPHFDTPHAPIIDELDRSISSCQWDQKRDFSLLSTNYNYSVCKDFSFYFWTELEHGMPPGVSPGLSELKLSFSQPGDGLSLLSAGFSHYLELHSDCFEKNLCSNHVYEA